MSRFVGRKEQLERLKDIFADVQGGAGKTLFLFGESGTGKYALLEHFAAEEKIPMVFFNHRHRERRNFAALKAIAADMKKKGFDTAPIDAAMKSFSSSGNNIKSRDTLLRDLAKGIMSCFSEPTILFLDNVHNADGETINLLPFMARECQTKPVLLGASYVNEGITERDGGAHPLMDAMGEMMAEELLQAMEIGPLSPHEAEQMMEGILGSKPPKALVFSVFSASKGNPLFISEMIDEMISRGVITPKEEGWASRIQMHQISLPSSLRDATRSALKQLGPMETTMLEIMSIMGTYFNEKHAMCIMGVGEEKVFDILLQLIERRLVDEEDGKYVLHHSSIADSVSERMKQDTLKKLHEKAFVCLDGEADPLTLAHHAQNAGMWEKAAELFLSSAEKSRNSYAFLTGKEVARLALSCAMKAGREDIANRAGLLLGSMCYEMGDWNEALPLLLQASKSREKLAGEALLYLGHLERNRSHWADAIENYSQALKLLDPKTVMAVDALRGMGKVSWRNGDMDAALENLKKSAETATELGLTGMLGSVCIDMGNVYHNMGRHEDSIANHKKAIDILMPLEAWGEIARAYNNTGEVYKENGDLSTAVEYYERAIDMGEKSGDKRIRAYALGNAAECNARLGETEKARRMADEAVDYFKSIEEEFVIASMQMTYGLIAATEKNWEEAWRRFEQGAASLELMGIKYDMTVVLLEYARALKKSGLEGSISKAKGVLSTAKETARSINAPSLVELIDKEGGA